MDAPRVEYWAVHSACETAVERALNSVDSLVGKTDEIGGTSKDVQLVAAMVVSMAAHSVDDSVLN